MSSHMRDRTRRARLQSGGLCVVLAQFWSLAWRTGEVLYWLKPTLYNLSPIPIIPFKKIPNISVIKFRNYSSVA